MKTQGSYILFETPSEFKEWLGKQKVTRNIQLIQEHHTATRLSAFNGNNHFALQNSMKAGHLARGFQDIAQQFTIFPDGAIMTGRPLNTAPAGIVGANSHGICIENFGYYDKAYDKMPKAQKDSIVAYTRILLNRFGLTPSASTIKYHCWYTAGGAYLGDYKTGKSCKTCPGTGFFGGNTMSAFQTGFLPLVKAYKAPASPKAQTKTQVTYQTHQISERTWSSPVTQYNQTDTNGYSGVIGKSIDMVTMKVSNGSLTYRAHRNGKWGAAITGYSTTDTRRYAGSAKQPIDAVTIKATGIKGTLRYRVHKKKDNKWGNWITGYSTTNTDKYAGSFGKEIDAIQIGID